MVVSMLIPERKQRIGSVTGKRDIGSYHSTSCPVTATEFPPFRLDRTGLAQVAPVMQQARGIPHKEIQSSNAPPPGAGSKAPKLIT
jgi:hypothetical protein